MFNSKWWKDVEATYGRRLVLETIKLFVLLSFMISISIAGSIGHSKHAASQLDFAARSGAEGTDLVADVSVELPENVIHLQIFSLEIHKSNLIALEAKLRADQVGKTLDERAAIGRQLNIVWKDLTRLRASYADITEDLRMLTLALAEYELPVSADQLVEARRALIEGDAQRAFDVLKDSEGVLKAIASTIAFELGETAENDVQWEAAAVHYGSAARLVPTIETLRKAHTFNWLVDNEVLAFRFSITMLEKVKVDHDLKNLISGYNMHARSMSMSGKVVRAEWMHEKALNIGSVMTGPPQGYFIANLHNLGHTILRQRRFAEAEAIFREVLEIQIDVHDEGSVNYARSLANLASAVRLQGRLIQAEGYYREALDLMTTNLGDDHPHTKSVAQRLDRLLAKIMAAE